MEPTIPEGYSTGFELKATGPMVQGLLAAIEGSVLAIIVALVPYPFSSVNDTEECARSIVSSTGSAWLAAIKYYCPDGDRIPTAQDRLQVDMHVSHMNKERRNLQGHIQNAWWECFGFGSSQRMRHVLTRLEILNRDRCDRLSATAATMLREEFEDSHAVVIKPCVSTIKRIAEVANELMLQATTIACSGVLPTE